MDSQSESGKMNLRLPLEWCRKIGQWHKRVGTRKVSKFVLIYGIYLVIVWAFDFIWMPYLAIRFQYLAFFPLYISLFLVCILGLAIYEFFQEDIFFKEKISEWLAEEGRYKFTRWLKGKINSSPRATFMAIATWWSPLHAYVYFRKNDRVMFSETMKLFLSGSFYCAFFWGVVIDILVALWDLAIFLKNNIPLYL